ncbi:MAG: nucleotide exchange factor GrpE [Lachnospiraceae bacterium]|nr:nucleotide exchange factor GrpE [Lachnospiraceae bacterium]
MANKKEKVSNENFDTEENKDSSVEETKDAKVEDAEEKDVDSKDSDNESDNNDSADENVSAKESDKDSDDTDDKDADEQDADENDADDSDESKDSKKSKKHFKNKKNKHQEIIDELNDKVMRQTAEFENFRKRNEKEKTKMYDMGAKNVLEKMLPVVDNFERGLDAAPEDDSFADGMKMIYKQLMTSLEEIGVKEIEAEGEEFNPDYHNAVMHIEDDELGENIVAEVLQKGYMYNDSVLRHAMVKVAN